MKTRRPAGLLLMLLFLATGWTAEDCSGRGPRLTQELIEIPGYVEPHTPGSGAPEEVQLAPDHPIVELLGPDPDLNTISYFRTAMSPRPSRRAKVVLILIPGFLGGGTTFDPLARQLVERFGGRLEVWAVDRRPNQLEDRVGAIHAVDGAEDPLCTSSPPAADCAIFEGAQFYFPDLDLPPLGNFPASEDKDVNLDGDLDEQLPLVDPLGVSRTAINLEQADVQDFFAYWGIDTYARDWKILAERARKVVGKHGVVLMGGHSQGTSWATVFAAYDFDPSVDVVDPGYEYIDGLVLIEGGGIGPGSLSAPLQAGYEQTVEEIIVGNEPAFLEDFSGIPLIALGNSGEVASIAGHFQPDEPSLIQRTPTFGTGLVAILLSAPATNQAVAGFFLDDDFSPIGAFRASIGFSDNGPNSLFPLPGLPPFYLAGPANDGSALRSWLDIDEVDETCVDPSVSPGCAIVDNGPPSNPDAPLESPKTNGVEREVSSVDDFLQTQFGKANGFEWYFVDTRVGLDFSYGRDSSALVEEFVDRDGNEGPLVVTQNANVDVPVLAIGGSNGLAPEPKSFNRYLASIATPEENQSIVILEGYAHVDPTIATDNEAVDAIATFVGEVEDQKFNESHKKVVKRGFSRRFDKQPHGRGNSARELH
jgi:pimeloyl-ACP methyl ester carboxylesterase